MQYPFFKKLGSYGMIYIPVKYLLLFLSLLISGSVFSQSPDTIVVYEYIYKTDTVWMEQKAARETMNIQLLQNSEDAMLIIDTTNHKTELVIFSCGKSATIPIKHIILSDNQKKKKSMKRFTFIGLTFLALNSSIFAQPKIEKNIGVYFRENVEIQTAFYHSLIVGDNSVYTGLQSTRYRMDPAFGIKGNFPLSPFLALSPRISFTQIGGGFEQNENRIDFTGKTMFYFLSTDLLLNYYMLKGKCINGRIYGGLRADCLVKTKEGVDLTDSKYENYRSILFNYVCGLGVDIGKHLYTELEYSNNINRFVSNADLTIKYGAFSINIGYYLF